MIRRSVYISKSQVLYGSHILGYTLVCAYTVYQHFNYYYFNSFKFLTPVLIVFQWGISGSKSLQNSSKNPCQFQWRSGLDGSDSSFNQQFFGIVPSAPTIIGITVILISAAFSSAQARLRYLFNFLPLFAFTLWHSKIFYVMSSIWH